jgi:hypothetical protein
MNSQKTILRDANGKIASEVSEVSEDEEERIRELVRRGFSERGARMEVLAKNHPIGCDCEVCS